MIRVRSALASIAVAGALIAVPASVAWAQGNPSSQSATASETVNATITLSGVSPSISFNAGNPGDTVQTTPAQSEAYSVITNDSTGYVLQLAPGSIALQSGGSANIPNSNITVQETGLGGLGALNNTGAPQTINTTHAATTGTGDHYTENWSLSIPAGAAATTFTESFQYNAIPN